VPRNVSEAVDPPKSQREEARPLSTDQVRRLLETARGDRLEALYVLAVHCGLRQGELLGLRWEDVDLEAGTLHVRRALALAKMARSLRPLRLLRAAGR
jgi:integrase